MGIATDLIYIVIAALIGGLIAHLLRQPLIFGYILAGIFVGPYTAGLTVEHIHDIEMLAEIGVALLLFTLGLEFSFGELKRLARITFIGTPLQIILCSLVGYCVALCLGLSPADATWIGAAISLSSTMVVLKTLSSREQLETEAGRIMLAILIAQDLAVIPLMLLLPQLTKETLDYTLIATALLKSLAFLIFMYLAGTRLLPRLFSLIAQQGSRELFFLLTLGIAFGAGFISYQLGLSFALGAFVAGMLLSETDFNHQALSDVSSLRDLFALIFFVSVGMLFDPHFFISHLGIIITLVLTIIISKAFITGGIVRIFNYDKACACTVGLGLSQVGEFAFVIINAGSRAGSFSTNSFSLMLSVTVVSMIATPALFWLASLISRIFKSSALPKSTATTDKTLSEHVIIIGGGVVGQYVAQVLAALDRPYVVIESDHKIITQMRDQGVRAVFGDGTRRVILEAAGLIQASLVVITTTNDKFLPLIIAEIKDLRRDLPIVVRVEEVEDVEKLSALKVEEIVQPQLEVGLEMVRQALLALNTDETQIFTLLGQLRAVRYEPDKSLGQRTGIDSRFMRAIRLLEFFWVEVKNDSRISGLSLDKAGLREKYGISIVAVVRGEEFISTPGPDLIITAGDILGALGTKKQLQEFRAGD